MKIILEVSDRTYFEEQLGKKVPDDVWFNFEYWIESNCNGYFWDECLEQLQYNLEESE